MPDAGPGRTRRLVLALLLCAASAGSPGAAEAPPAQGTRLRFQKTLSIQTTSGGRVFLETRRVAQGDTLASILARDYGVAADGATALTEAFRAANPGLDPNRLPPGQTVRIPFKLEETPGSAPAPPPPAAEKTHVVRKGESLWRILKNRFRVPRDAMPQALKAVARANPSVKNLDHLVAGQRLVIPGSLAGEPTAVPPARPAPSLPDVARPLFKLLEALGCRVSTSGDTFLPLGRGRTVHLDSREFPLVTGPTGRHVILDPGNRLSVALTRSLERAWGYSVLQGTEAGLEATLSRLLPGLGFHGLTEEPRAVDAVPGARLVARPRWTVVPRPEDPWEGKVHLLFPAGARLDPDLAALTLDAGFSLHLLGAEPSPGGTEDVEAAPDAVPELPGFEAGRAEGALLAALGIAHRVRPDVECDLGGGVSYHLRPELTFDFEGTAYAVPPPEPRRAEALLERTGYFTVPLPDPTLPFDRLRDLLALLRIRAERARIVAPAEDAALRLTVEGLAFEAPEAVRRLYPSADAEAVRRVLVTEAELPPRAARVLLGRGYAPWVLRRARERSAP